MGVHASDMEARYRAPGWQTSELLSQQKKEIGKFSNTERRSLPWFFLLLGGGGKSVLCRAEEERVQVSSYPANGQLFGRWLLQGRLMLRSGSKSRSGRGGAKEGVGKSVWEGWWRGRGCSGV